MEADLKAQVTVSRFRAYGSIGYMAQNAQTTQITSFKNDPNCSTTGPTFCTGNLVSREHWVGVDLGEDKQFLLRAGRIDIPFGIRQDEHDLMVRNTATTRTNINESQQHGVAFSYSGEKVRGEIMAVLGNYQINPDAFRERGYSGFAEFSLAQWAAFGVSSKVTYAAVDYLDGTAHTIRQVHGVFTRLVPVKPLVILAEADALIITSDLGGTSPGVVDMVQADVEPTQGLHLIATGESWVQNNYPVPGKLDMSYGAWLGALWFFAPHCDARFDFVASSVAGGPISFYLLPQLHVYL